MDISAIAIQGIDQAQSQLETLATSLAQAGISASGTNLDVVDLSAAVVALASAKIDFSVNAAVFQTAGQLEKHLTDLIA